MRKIYYLILAALLFGNTESKAQLVTGFTVTGDPSDCTYTHLKFSTTVPAASLRAELNLYGTINDTNVVLVMSAPYGGRADFVRYIHTPGNYTFKLTLADTFASIVVDSLIGSITKLHCGFSSYGLYNDVNGNCNFDAGDNPITNPALIEVSTGGVPVDTFSCYNNLNFMSSGVAGTVYAYRLIQPPTGFVLSCPSSGIVYDTVGVYNVPKNFGFTCSSTATFDLSTYISVLCRPGMAWASIIVKNATCSATNADIALNFSPKFNYSDCTVAPTFAVANNASWHLPSMRAFADSFLFITLRSPGPMYFPGDTVNSKFEVTPIAGDVNPTNNIVIRVDTVRAGWDPNDIAVYPAGYIAAGTELEYTVRFENTGNDTAFNIHVLDTLPNHVDFNTISVVAASHNMNTVIYSTGGYNIMKFDFPNINLLDSSHHGECNGMFVFKIKSKTGLAYGTQIKNQVGIYFDYNPVVMTNTVINTIPFPTDVTALTTGSGVSIYPNPVTDLLHIKTTKATFNTATITNIIGQVVATAQPNGVDETINVQSLPPGIYFLYLRGDGASSVQRFEKL